MKKNVCLVIPLLAIVLSSNNCTGDRNFISKDRQLSTDATNRLYNSLVLNELGHGIDFAYSNSLAYKDASNRKKKNVFDARWLESFYDECKDNLYPGSKEGTVTVFKGKSITEITDNIKTSIESDNKVSGSYAGLKASVGLSFKLNTETKLHTKETTFLYNYHYNKKVCSMGIGSIECAVYNGNHFDSHYIDDLSYTLNLDSQEGYDNFFNKYGSHILVDADFGALYDVYYSCQSKAVNLDVSVSTSVVAEISAGCEAKEGDKTIGSAEASSKNGFSMSRALGVNSECVEENVSAYFVGGTGTGTSGSTTFDGIISDAKDWVNTIDSNPVIIAYNEILPLWNILPQALDTTANYKKLQNAYKVRCEHANQGFDDRYKSIDKETVKDFYQVVKPGENAYCGHYWDKKRDYYVKINFLESQYNLYDPRVMDAKGYKHVSIHVYFSVTEGRSETTLTVELNSGGKEITAVKNLSMGKDDYQNASTLDLETRDLYTKDANLHLNCMTNKRGAGFLYFKEREAILSNVYYIITYSK